MIRSKPGVLASAAASLLLLASCRGTTTAVAPSPLPSLSPTPTAVPSVGSDGYAWIAGLAQASDPNDLDEDYSRLEPKLGGVLQVSPGTCFTGAPPPYDGPEYLLLVIAGSKSELDRLVSGAKLEVLFEARVGQMCID